MPCKPPAQLRREPCKVDRESPVTALPPTLALETLAAITTRYGAARRSSREAIRDAIRLSYQLVYQFSNDLRYRDGPTVSRLLNALEIDARELCAGGQADSVALAVIKAVTKPKSRSQHQLASERSRAVREVVARDLQLSAGLKLLETSSVRGLASAFAERSRRLKPGPINDEEKLLLKLSPSLKLQVLERLARKRRIKVEIRRGKDGNDLWLNRMIRTKKVSSRCSIAG